MRKRAAQEPSKETKLELIPVMNLVTILIPFALLSAQFVHLPVIDVNAPAINPEPAPDAEPPPKLSISESGFALILDEELSYDGPGN